MNTKKVLGIELFGQHMLTLLQEKIFMSIEILHKIMLILMENSQHTVTTTLTTYTEVENYLKIAI